MDLHGFGSAGVGLKNKADGVDPGLCASEVGYPSGAAGDHQVDGGARGALVPREPYGAPLGVGRRRGGHDCVCPLDGVPAGRGAGPPAWLEIGLNRACACMGAKRFDNCMIDQELPAVCFHAPECSNLIP